jgi:hypothetical protein
LNLDNLPERLFAPIMMWVAFGLGVGHCLLVSLWAAGRLRRDFRSTVTSRFQPAPLRRWWRPTRRAVMRYGIGALSAGAALLLIVVSFYGYQNWRSRRAWSKFQTELKQRKETLNVSALLPGPVPQSQNFALTTVFQSWASSGGSNNTGKTLRDKLKDFETAKLQPANSTGAIDWIAQNYSPLDDYVSWIAPKTIFRGEPSRDEVANTILKALEPHADTVRSLAKAARLAYFQPSTNRDEKAVLYPARNDVAALERLHMLLQVRACALLATNRSNEAAEDLLSSLQLVRLARQLPDVQSSMRVQILLARSLQPLWEGIVGHQWTEAQLKEFQNQLSQYNLLADHTNAVRRVILASIEMWRRMADDKRAKFSVPAGRPYLNNPAWQMQPRAWQFDNCIQLYQAGENAIGKIDVAGGRVSMQGEYIDVDGLPLDEKTSMFLQQSPWLGASPGLVAFAQTVVNQSIIACALERYRLAHGCYPETLEDLIPSYLPAIPKDITRGRSMLYENTGNERFILRSVGPNQIDDRKNKSSDDWLWAFPTNAPPAVPK